MGLIFAMLVVTVASILFYSYSIHVIYGGANDNVKSDVTRSEEYEN